MNSVLVVRVYKILEIIIKFMFGLRANLCLLRFAISLGSLQLKKKSSETFPESCKTYKMELFPLSSNLDVWQCCEYASDI